MLSLAVNVDEDGCELKCVGQHSPLIVTLAGGTIVVSSEDDSTQDVNTHNSGNGADSHAEVCTGNTGTVDSTEESNIHLEDSFYDCLESPFGSLNYSDHGYSARGSLKSSFEYLKYSKDGYSARGSGTHSHPSWSLVSHHQH